MMIHYRRIHARDLRPGDLFWFAGAVQEVTAPLLQNPTFVLVRLRRIALKLPAQAPVVVFGREPQGRSR